MRQPATRSLSRHGPMRSIHEIRGAWLRPGVEPLPARKLAGHGGGLELAALGRRMGGQVARQSDEDAPAFRSVAPVSKLTDCCLQDLIGVESGVFTQDGMRERREEAPGVVLLLQVTGNVLRSPVDRAMPVERIEELLTQGRAVFRQIVQPLARFAWQSRRRHV